MKGECVCGGRHVWRETCVKGGVHGSGSYTIHTIRTKHLLIQDTISLLSLPLIPANNATCK